MGRIVPIPAAGVRDRRTSDGTSLAIGKQTARGTPLNRVNFVSTAGTDSIAAEQSAAAPFAFYFEGDGTITFTASSALGADADIVLSGRDADGNVLTETVTITNGNDAITTTENFCGYYLITATPEATNFGARTLEIEATTRALTVSDGMYRLMYPVSNVDINEQADTQESDLFSAIGAATEPEIGQYWGQANFTTGILNEELPYLLYGMFPTSKTSTPYEDVDQASIASMTANTPITLTPPVWMTGGNPDPDKVRPAKIKLSFATAPGAGVLRVRGYVKVGPAANNVRFRTETIEINTTDTDYETENYYINNATYPTTLTSSIAITAAATPTWDPELYTIDFEIANPDTLFDGWSMQGLVGGVPRTAFDVTPGQIEITATPGGISIAYQCAASRVEELRTIQGGVDEQLLLNTDYEVIPSTRMGGWSGGFRYGTDLVKYTNLVITFNRNYNPDEAANEDRFRTDIEQSANRVVTVVPTTRYRSGNAPTDVFSRWQDLFRNKQRTALSSRAYSYTAQGQQRQFIVECPSALLTESPQTVANAAGNIDQPLNFQAFTNAAGDSEIKITLETTKSYTV